LPDRAIRQQIASAVSLIVQVARLSDGSRRVTQVSEVTGTSDDMVTLQDIFVFDRLGIGPNNRVLGRFRATGLRPTFGEKLRASGIQIPMSVFEHVCEV
jgi:pilus assembly protein CpaF